MSNPTSPLDLGTLPVSKLLKQYAFPAIVAMTASSLYNMVDSIFIGHGVGPLAISGLAPEHPGPQGAGQPLHGGHRQGLCPERQGRRCYGGRLELRLRLLP